MRAVCVAAILTAGSLFGQNTPADRDALRQKVKIFLAQRQQLLGDAKAAFDREMAREKSGVCQEAQTTFAENQCLSAEIGNTAANHDAYAAALRSLLSLRYPGSTPGAAASGPTGAPLTLEETLREFDDAATAWKKYSAVQCHSAYGLFKGGTIAPSVSETCELLLLRTHMRILNGIYGDYFSH